MDETRTFVDTSDDCFVVEVVARVRVKLVVSIVRWTFEADDVLSSTALFVRPVASVNSIVVNKSFRFALAPLGNSKCTLGVISYTVRCTFFGENAKLPWTSGRRICCWSCFVRWTWNVPVVSAKFVNCTVLLIQKSIWTCSPRTSAIDAKVILVTVCVVRIMMSSFGWTSFRWTSLTDNS